MKRALDNESTCNLEELVDMDCIFYLSQNPKINDIKHVCVCEKGALDEYK